VGLLSRLFRRSGPGSEPRGPELSDLLRQVRRIEMRTRGLVASRFSGEYHSVFKGQGIEFVEVREYLPGDDVRTIDWNVSARTGGVFVKKYVEERELTVLLAVDVSASHVWGTRTRTKHELVAEAAATLAMSAVRNNDRVGLMAFSEHPELFVPPRRGRRHALRIIRDLLALRPQGRGTDLAAHLERATRMLRSRSIVFLISDFLVGDGLPALDRALTAAAARHDVVPVMLTDPGDVTIPDVGLLRLEDPESGELAVVDTSRAAVRERLATAAAAEQAAIRRIFRRLGLDEMILATDQATAPAVLSFFRRRERRLRR
jgi:uncharacterized protein (DUF58 family)